MLLFIADIKFAFVDVRWKGTVLSPSNGYLCLQRMFDIEEVSWKYIWNLVRKVPCWLSLSTLRAGQMPGWFRIPLRESQMEHLDLECSMNLYLAWWLSFDSSAVRFLLQARKFTQVEQIWPGTATKNWIQAGGCGAWGLRSERKWCSLDLLCILDRPQFSLLLPHLWLESRAKMHIMWYPFWNAVNAFPAKCLRLPARYCESFWEKATPCVQRLWDV